MSISRIRWIKLIAVLTSSLVTARAFVYFGNLATAGCAGDGNCHGGTDQPGYQVSMFLCPSGDASAACYAGITSPLDGGAGLILPDASFNTDFLSQILCTTDGGGEMPEGWSAQQCLFDGCNYEFTPTDMQRIANWVAAGAPNN